MPSARLTLRVIPRAQRTEISGKRGDAYAIRLQAPPVEGAANKALAKFLAELLGVRASDVRVVAGDKSRDKIVEIQGVSQEEAERVFAEQSAP